MPYVKCILLDQNDEIEVKDGGYWDSNNNWIPPGNSRTYKTNVMPWNKAKDREIIEAGGYTNEDRKCYSKYVLHENMDELEITYKGDVYKAKYISDYNVSDINLYGLKKVLLNG